MKITGIVLLPLVASAASLSPTLAETSQSTGVVYGGRAFAAYLRLPTLGVSPTTISEAGPLPAAGGSDSSTLLTLNLPGILKADVLDASTSAAQGAAESEASLTNVVILPGHLAQVTASLVRAESQASCLGAGGGSTITNLTFAGLSVVVTGQPNQTVSIPGLATLVINEQSLSGNTASHAMTVRALHLTLFTGDEVILSHAETSVTSPEATAEIFAGDGINADTITPVKVVLGSTWSAPLQLGHPHGTGGLLLLRIHTTTINGNNVVSPLGGRLTEFLVGGPLLCQRIGFHDGQKGDIPTQRIPNDCSLVGMSWAVQYVVFGGGFADLSQAVFGICGIE